MFRAPRRVSPTSPTASVIWRRCAACDGARERHWSSGSVAVTKVIATSEAIRTAALFRCCESPAVSKRDTSLFRSSIGPESSFCATCG